MKVERLQISRLDTERLILVPFTITICRQVRKHNFTALHNMGFKPGIGWPDEDVLETLPKIIINLTMAGYATGFESWMIIKKDTKEVIGDIGFKGFNYIAQNIDIGYGLIAAERGKGYAEEASKALINWAFNHGRVKEITAQCLTNNKASIKLLKKLQFTQQQRNDEYIFWRLQNA